MEVYALVSHAAHVESDTGLQLVEGTFHVIGYLDLSTRLFLELFRLLVALFKTLVDPVAINPCCFWYETQWQPSVCNFSGHSNSAFHPCPEKDWDIRVHVQDGLEGLAEAK